MLEIKKKSGKVTKVGNIISVLVFVIALILAWLVDGWSWWSFFMIPLFFLGLFGSLVGIIPFVGPLIYFFGVGWLFDTVIKACGLVPGLGSALIFYYYLAYSIVFCFISTLVFLVGLSVALKTGGIKKHEESGTT